MSWPVRVHVDLPRRASFTEYRVSCIPTFKKPKQNLIYKGNRNWKGSYHRPNNGSQICPSLNLWQVWRLTECDQKDFADMINFRILRWEDYRIDLNCNYILKSRGKGGLNTVDPCDWNRERYEHAILWAARMEEGTRSQRLSSLVQLEKKKKINFPLDSLGNQTLLMP